MREEGGTPAIVESIRAGLVFQLKQVRIIFRIEFVFSVMILRTFQCFVHTCPICKAT